MGAIPCVTFTTNACHGSKCMCNLKQPSVVAALQICGICWMQAGGDNWVVKGGVSLVIDGMYGDMVTFYMPGLGWGVGGEG